MRSNATGPTATGDVVQQLAASSSVSLPVIIIGVLLGIYLMVYSLSIDERERAKVRNMPLGRAVLADWGLSRLLARLPLTPFRAIPFLLGLGMVIVGVGLFFFD